MNYINNNIFRSSIYFYLSLVESGRQYLKQFTTALPSHSRRWAPARRFEMSLNANSGIGWPSNSYGKSTGAQTTPSWQRDPPHDSKLRCLNVST